MHKHDRDEQRRSKVGLFQGKVFKLRAVNASKVKLNQVIQYRQEREAEIDSASEPVANEAFIKS